MPDSSGSDGYTFSSQSIDEIREAFEKAWHAGNQLQIEDVLSKSAVPNRAKLFEALLSAELRLRCSHGETPTWKEYLARFAEYSDIARNVFDVWRRDTTVQASSSPVTTRIGRPAPTDKPTDRDERRQLPSLAQFGGYELLEEIARGGMGVVYKARQKHPSRIVALKMILAGQLADEDDVQRFQSEANAAAQLEHPNIVPIYEVGEHNGHHFFTMRYIEGESLSARLDKGPLPPFEAAEILKVIADAAAYAHARDVIHRDLKTANVLLDRDGTPLVTDFGLAKFLESDSGLTATGEVLGTPSYMSPEQARNTEQVGPLSDVYSLGAVLYSLLTGRPPFRASSILETLEQVLEQEPISPRRLNSAVDRDLETICLKCLEKLPSRRYSSAQSLSSELDRYLNRRPIQARPVGAAARAWRWCRRRPLTASLIFLVVFSLLGGTGASSYFAVEANSRAEQNRLLAISEKEARDEADKQRADSEEESRRARRREQQARWNAYILAMNAVFEELRNGRTGHAVELLEQQIPADDQPDLRSLEWYLAWQECHSEKAVLRGHRGPVNALAYSPDGARLVSASDDRTVRIWDAVTLELQATLTDHNDAVQGVTFSPDGETLATASDDQTVRVWYAATHECLMTLPAAAGHPNDLGRKGVRHIRFSPDGKLLAVCTQDGTLRIWETATWSEWLVLSQAETGWAVGMEFAPDSEVLAVSGDNAVVTLWDIVSRTQLTRFGSSGWTYCLDFTSDGQHLAGSGRSLFVFDVGNRRRQVLKSADSGRYLWITLSPDDELLVAAGGSGGGSAYLEIWDWQAERQLASLSGHTAQVNQVVFSPDGGTLATAGDDATVRLWVVNQFARQLPSDAHGEGVLDCAISPDGTRVLTGSNDQTAKLWDTASGHLVKTLNLDGSVYSAAYSPDGRTIAATTTRGERSLRVYDAETYQLRFVLNHEQSVTASVFSPDGNTLVTGTNGTLRWIDVESGETLRRVRPHTDWIRDLVYSHDGRHVAAASGDKTASLLDDSTGTIVKRFIGHTGWITDLALSPDGRSLFTGSLDATVRVWDVESGNTTAVLKMDGADEQVHALDLSSDGKILAAGTEQQHKRGTVHLWEVPSLNPLERLNRMNDTVHGLQFSSDNNSILAGYASGTSILWDLKSREPLEYFGRGQEIRSIAFSPDNRSVALGRNQQVTVLDTETWTPQTVRDVEHDNVDAVTFSGDGRYLAAGMGNWQAYGPGTVRVWDLTTGGEVAALPDVGKTIAALSFSPDGSMLAAVPAPGQGNVATVWDTATWKTRFLLQHPPTEGFEIEGFHCLAFSPDNTTLATGSADYFGVRPGLVTLWDTATGTRFGTLSGHRSSVSDLVIPPDGKSLISCSFDETIRVWDMKTGVQTDDLSVAPAVIRLALMPQDQRLVAGCRDGSVQVFDSDSWQQLAVIQDGQGANAGIRGLALAPDSRYRVFSQGLSRRQDRLRIWKAATSESVNAAVTSRTQSTLSVETVPDETQSDLLKSLQGALERGDTSMASVFRGSQLLHRPQNDLDEFDRESRVLIEEALTGSLPWNQLAESLAAVESRQTRREKIDATARARLEQRRKQLTDQLISKTREDLSSDRTDDALKTAKRLLRLSPEHTEAGKLQEEIHDSLPPRETFTNSLGMEFIRMNSGRFVMGSPSSETHRDKDESAHPVYINNGFWIADREVTRDQFGAFVEATQHETDAQLIGKAGGLRDGKREFIKGITWESPGFDQNGDHPVVCVSWNDAAAFCRWLSEQEGKSYRLPAESEWEYVARANGTTAYIWGDDATDGEGWDNLADASAKEVVSQDILFVWNDQMVYTAPSGHGRVNRWGVYGIAGNVREWCGDFYNAYPVAGSRAVEQRPLGTMRVLRGGSWRQRPKFCRLAYRHAQSPDYSSNEVGFRLVCELEPAD